MEGARVRELTREMDVVRVMEKAGTAVEGAWVMLDGVGLLEMSGVASARRSVVLHRVRGVDAWGAAVASWGGCAGRGGGLVATGMTEARRGPHPAWLLAAEQVMVECMLLLLSERGARTSYGPDDKVLLF
jgi:hypothetical protein